MDDLALRVRALEQELERLRTKDSAALHMIEATQTAGAGGLATIRLPVAGNFPTNYKNLVIVGMLRSLKAAVTFDTLNFTVNAVAANYYMETLSNSAATTAVAAESRAAANWNVAIAAATAPASHFSQIVLRIFDYNTAYVTGCELRVGLMLATTANNLRTYWAHGWINSAQVVNYLTFAAAGGNLDQGSYLTAYGESG